MLLRDIPLGAQPCHVCGVPITAHATEMPSVYELRHGNVTTRLLAQQLAISLMLGDVGRCPIVEWVEDTVHQGER